MDTIPYGRKLNDTKGVVSGGKVDKHWNGKILKNVFTGHRKAPQGFNFWDQHYVLDYFKLRGFEYGNWLSQMDRYTHLAGAAFAMRDFCDVIGLDPQYFGLDEKITLSFGARGKGGSLAHFEPNTWAINITRHRKRHSELDPTKYLGASGAGSLGHEYGHALDFLAGRNLDKLGPHNFATEIIESAIKKAGKDKEGPLFKRTDYKLSGEVQKASYDLMYGILYQEKEGVIRPSSWNKSLLQYAEGLSRGRREYFTSTIEVLARSFEVYLHYKCRKKKISESYLKESKYTGAVYPPISLIKEVEPLFDKWLEVIYRQAFGTKIKP